ncbi:MAG: efflux RND transporter periplasmic adaptor subunit [Bacteroidota bacterium]
MTLLLHLPARTSIGLRSLRQLLCAVALVLVLSACGGSDPEPAPPPAVRVVQVAAPMPESRSFSGTTQAAVESRVSFQVGGTVVRTLVDVGAPVARGQLLAVLNPTDFQLQAEQSRSGVAVADQRVAQARAGAAAAESGVTAAQAALEQARAGARLAEAEFSRVRALYAEDLVPLSLFDATRTQAETARAAVAAAESAVAQAQAGAEAAHAGIGTAAAAASASRNGARLASRQLGYTRLYAPVSGAVAAVLVEPGELVSPGQPVALVTSQGGPMEVEVSVPESVIGQIETGGAAVVRISSLPEETFAATVTEVGVAPGRTPTTFPVTVRLNRADPRVRSGQAASVEIDVERGGTVVPVIPASAVNEDASGVYVLVLSAGAPGSAPDEGSTPQADATVTRRAVETGALRPDGVEVTDGLRSGDRIVAAGGGGLSDGEAVRVLDRDPLSASLDSF